MIVAGLISLYSCFIGIFGALWGGFGRGHEDPEILGFWLPFLLALPLFALSLGITRFASLGLWLLIPYHWFWLVIHFTDRSASWPLEFARTSILCLIESTEILFILVAVLVQFGLQIFKKFRFDEYLYERMRGASESGA